MVSKGGTHMKPQDLETRKEEDAWSPECKATLGKGTRARLNNNKPDNSIKQN